MSASALLDRLDGVRSTGPGRWLAKCPAHEDRSPSLSIRELNDGRTLINCFAGCGAIDVLDALGLEWSALFPERDHRGFPPSHSKIPARDLLETLDHEVMVAALIIHDVIENRGADHSHWQRLAQAYSRISKARDYVR